MCSMAFHMSSLVAAHSTGQRSLSQIWAKEFRLADETNSKPCFDHCVATVAVASLLFPDNFRFKNTVGRGGKGRLPAMQVSSVGAMFLRSKYLVCEM